MAPDELIFWMTIDRVRSLSTRSSGFVCGRTSRALSYTQKQSSEVTKCTFNVLVHIQKCHNDPASQDFSGKARASLGFDKAGCDEIGA